jgi:hypothetical protein
MFDESSLNLVSEFTFDQSKARFGTHIECPICDSTTVAEDIKNDVYIECAKDHRSSRQS